MEALMKPTETKPFQLLSRKNYIALALQSSFEFINECIEQSTDNLTELGYPYVEVPVKKLNLQSEEHLDLIVEVLEKSGWDVKVKQLPYNGKRQEVLVLE